MDKAKSILKWVLINGTMGWMAYMGAIQGSTGWGRVFLLAFWAHLMWTILISIIAHTLSPKQLRKEYRVPSWLNASTSMALAGVLAYAGWMATAVFVMLSIVAEETCRDNLKKRYDELVEEAARVEAANKSYEEILADAAATPTP